jgi:hypothetical protein
MGSVVLDGKSPEVVAAEIGKSVDDVFGGHEALKRLVYPFYKENPRDITSKTRNAREAKLQEKWGAPTSVNASRSTPIVEEAGPEGDMVRVHHEAQLSREDYAPGAHVLDKDIQYSKPKQVSEAVKSKSSDSTSSADSKARWEELKAELNLKNKESEPETLPTPTAEPAPKSVEDSAEPVGDVADPEDTINTNAPTEFSDEEQSVIKAWIDSAYADHDPSEISKALYGHVMAMTWDITVAAAKIQTDLHDLSISHNATIRIAGIPFMPAGSVVNASHKTAGVVGVASVAERRSKATKWFKDLMDPTVHTDSYFSKLRVNMTKESKLLEGSILDIKRRVVNQAAMTRKAQFDVLNEVYTNRLYRGEYISNAMAGLSKKERFKLAAEAFFDPTKVSSKDAFDIFEIDGVENPMSTIEALFEGNSTLIFGDSKLEGAEFIKKMALVNSYMDPKYRLTSDEIELLAKAGLTAKPYSREWFSAAGEVLGETSKLRSSKLKEVNLAALHHSINEAANRIDEGRKLYTGVWREFSFSMDPAIAKKMNDELHGATKGINGKPMRSKVIAVNKNLIRDWGIPSHAIPQEFITGERFIEEDFIPQLALLFKYMEGTGGRLSEALGKGVLDKILQSFKASVTIYKIPTYPIRNLIGDVMMSAFDGLFQPKYYKNAAAIAQNASHLSKEVDEANLSQYMNQDIMQGEIAKATHDPMTVADPTTGPGITYTSFVDSQGNTYKLNDVEMMNLFNMHGLGQNQISGEVKEALAASRMTKLGMTGGKFHDAVRTSNDWRETWARMAHFLYALEKEAPMGGDIQAIARRAAGRVRKHHFDYNDVSNFERNYVAPVIPFYKWVRNIIPYTIGSVIARPYTLKLEQGIQQGLELLDDNPDDPRTDFVVPDYISRERAVDVGWYTDKNNFKFMQWASVNLPLSDTISGTFSPVLDPWLDPSIEGFSNKFIGSGEGVLRVKGAMENPIIKAAVQGQTNTVTWPTGPKSEGANENWLKTLSTAIPGMALADSYGKAVNAFSTKDGSSDKNDIAQLLSSLGFIGLTNNSEKAQIGEMRRLQNLNQGKRTQLMAKLDGKIKESYPNLTEDERHQAILGYLKEKRAERNSVGFSNVS